VPAVAALTVAPDTQTASKEPFPSAAYVCAMGLPCPLWALAANRVGDNFAVAWWGRIGVRDHRFCRPHTMDFFEGVVGLALCLLQAAGGRVGREGRGM
jgi:hypothetical protein